MAAEQSWRPGEHPGRRPAAATPFGVRANVAPAFRLDDLTVGPHAHGFGVTEDGRPFSFRVVGTIATVRIYRSDLDPRAVPARADVEAATAARVSDVDLSEPRSVIAMVRDMTTQAISEADADRRSVIRRVVRTLFDGWTQS